MGDAMLGLAAVASTRPAWAGTAAATLLNMMMDSVCAVYLLKNRYLEVVVGAGRCWDVCVGVAEMIDGDGQ